VRVGVVDNGLTQQRQVAETYQTEANCKGAIREMLSRLTPDAQRFGPTSWITLDKKLGPLLAA
jgi:hypothetical protein